LRTSVGAATGEHRLYQELTGTRRSHRRIETGCNEENVGMIAVNAALGFRRHSAWFAFVRRHSA
jgi:hypothetical protein